MDRAHHTDPQQLARAVADAMYPRDNAANALAIVIDDIGPGRARLRMTVRREMLNGHGLCHGGFIFALADTAFAYACNSHNHNTVASGCSIEYLAPAHEGDVLIATGEERVLNGRTGVYDIEVNTQDGRLIAVFRGKSHRIKGQVVPDDNAQAAG